MSDIPVPPSNLLRTKLARRDTPPIGTFCSLADAASAEVLSSSGFDFVVVDAQHGGPTMDTLADLLRSVELGGAASLVRLPWNDPAQIMRALDLGADGVVIPMVSTADDAQRAASACRYPPAGIRSFGQIRGKRYGEPDRTNDHVLCIVIIETEEGLSNIDAIAATPGIDGILIGPIDLTLSLGLTIDFTLTEPTIAGALERILAAGDAHSCPIGLPLFGTWMAESAISSGYRFLTIGGDSGYIRAGAAADLKALRELENGVTT